MKTNKYLNILLAAGLATSLTACDENAWNNHLNGFEEQNQEEPADVKTIEYTLTADDYAAIASNATNQALAGDELKSALAAVKTRRAFSDEITAMQYVPAFLASTSFPYFSLSNGSSIKLTYNVQTALPAELKEAAQAQTYTVTDDQYMNLVWESDDNYVNGFAPSHPASKYLGKIAAATLDVGDGQYAVIQYNASTQEPVFGGVQGGGEEPGFKLSETIGQATDKAPIDCNAVVTGICAQGYIVTDASGSILVYMGSAFDPTTVQLGQQLTISGTVGSYNKGLQITGSSATVEVIGTQEVTYPTAQAMTGAELDAAATRTTNQLAQYISITGTAVVTEKNINIKVDGAATAQGSVYQGTAAQKAMFTDGETVTVEGYFIAVAASRYINMVVTKVNGKAPAKRRTPAKAPAAPVPMTTYNTLMHYTDGAWQQDKAFIVLNPDDYTAMGQQYQNLTNPNALLPIFLRNKLPYAQADQAQNVMYLYYDSTSKSTFYMADRYVYNGTDWVLDNGIVTETNQFVKTGGQWMYDPCVTITLPAGRGQELSTLYYQTCVDWVYTNICQPLGDTSIKSGKFYISSYGNNEYYSGTSAYQGNLDLRGDKAREQYPAGYEGLTDQQIVDLMKQRFMNEVMPGALSILHPDAKPVDGIDVLYTINFAVYNGSTTNHTAVFRVIAPGKFEPVSCTWDSAE